MGVSSGSQAFTSNQPPEKLYLGGLNRKFFMPFVRLVRDRCLVHEVDNGVGVSLPTLGPHLGCGHFLYSAGGPPYLASLLFGTSA